MDGLHCSGLWKTLRVQILVKDGLLIMLCYSLQVKVFQQENYLANWIQVCWNLFAAALMKIKLH
jgi:hypothetical protein